MITWAPGSLARSASLERGRPRIGPASTITYLTPAARSAAVSGSAELITGASRRVEGLSAAIVVDPTCSASFQIMDLARNFGHGSNTASPWFHGYRRYSSHGSSSAVPLDRLESISCLATIQSAGYPTARSRSTAPQAKPGNSTTEAIMAVTAIMTAGPVAVLPLLARLAPEPPPVPSAAPAAPSPARAAWPAVRRDRVPAAMASNAA